MHVFSSSKFVGFLELPPLQQGITILVKLINFMLGGFPVLPIGKNDHAKPITHNRKMTSSSKSQANAEAPLSGSASKRMQKGPLGQILGYLLANASILTNRVFEEQVHKALKLRKVEYTILNLVENNPGIKANKVSKALGFSAANTSVWLEKMCDKKLLTREPDPVDKRAMHLFITPAGRDLCHTATDSIVQGEADTMKHLTHAEAAMLMELLKKYAAARPIPHTE